MEEETITLNEYFAVLRRRKWLLLGVAAVIFFAVSLALAFGLSPVYRSTATILIEQQEIPQDLVRSTITTFADQRIQSISQRVMTTANLMDIINKYNLYRDERDREPIEAILEQMHEDIQLAMVSAEFINPRTGRPSEATIAFTLSYESPSPRSAQRVTEELASLYLSENVRIRHRLASETSDFLADEAEKLKAQVMALEGRLAEFKERNAGRLPELVELNLQLMARLERELLEVERQIRAQEQNQIHLRSQLAQLSPTSGTVVTSSGERLLGPEEQLRVLETQYVSLSARYAPDHPDLVRVRKEIAALRAEVGTAGASDEGRARLAAVRAELAEAREKYSPDHPDVKRLARTVRNLEAQWERVRTETIATVETPDNPVYIEAEARLNATDAELRTLRAKQQALRAKLGSYEDRLMQTPQVEREYRNLTRDYENALQYYQDVKAKHLDAQLAESLEAKRKAERFTLIEPPQLPEAPVTPSRLGIAFLGLVLSLGGGIGAATVVELRDQSVRGVKQVTRLLGEPPLAVIPSIGIPGGEPWRALRHGLVAVLMISSTLLAVVLFHEFVLPLDAAWLALLNRLGN